MQLLLHSSMNTLYILERLKKKDLKGTKKISFKQVFIDHDLNERTERIWLKSCSS